MCILFSNTHCTSSHGFPNIFNQPIAKHSVSNDLPSFWLNFVIRILNNHVRGRPTLSNLLCSLSLKFSEFSISGVQTSPRHVPPHVFPPRKRLLFDSCPYFMEATGLDSCPYSTEATGLAQHRVPPPDTFLVSHGIISECLLHSNRQMSSIPRLSCTIPTFMDLSFNTSSLSRNGCQFEATFI